jgi:hypothetical protein
MLPETTAEVADRSAVTRLDSTALSWLDEPLKTWSTALTHHRHTPTLAGDVGRPLKPLFQALPAAYTPHQQGV